MQKSTFRIRFTSSLQCAALWRRRGAMSASHTFSLSASEAEWAVATAMYVPRAYYNCVAELLFLTPLTCSKKAPRATQSLRSQHLALLAAHRGRLSRPLRPPRSPRRSQALGNGGTKQGDERLESSLQKLLLLKEASTVCYYYVRTYSKSEEPRPAAGPQQRAAVFSESIK